MGAGKRHRLCRELEQYAASFAVLANGRLTRDCDSGYIDRAIDACVVRMGRRMMVLSRQLIRDLNFDDDNDLRNYVRALNASRLRSQ